MKTISTGLQTHIEGETTTLASCWRIERADGEVLAFTDHDVDIAYDTVTYKADTGFTRSAIKSVADLSVDQLDVEGLLNSTQITAEDIRAHCYDNAEFYIFMINWADKSQGIIKLRRGNLGEITLRRGVYVAELQGLSQQLSRELLNEFSPDCDADFGDTRCAFNTATLAQTGAVTGVSTSRRVFTVSGVNFALAGLPSYGLDLAKIEWTSGLNDGLYTEVKTAIAGTGTLALYLKSAFTIGIGDTFTIVPGCDKRFVTCQAYANSVNHRGFPLVPGQDDYLKYPNARA
jgi:uncharacterized phage protein (TIGR02218 family)